jgi:hypothetical protein
LVSPGQLQVPAVQVLVPLQEPQEVTVRDRPQESRAVSGPQERVLRAQNAASDSEVQPQVPGVPPPPQVVLVGQEPQFTVRAVPQASVRVCTPQLNPEPAHSWESLSGWQTHEPAVVQTVGLVQFPHPIDRLTPHRSVTLNNPQLRDAAPHNAASVSGAHTAPPPPPVPPPIAPPPVPPPVLVSTTHRSITHRSPDAHTWHASPLPPHEASVVESTQLSSAAQHPRQLLGPHAGAVGAGHAEVTRTTHNAIKKRMEHLSHTHADHRHRFNETASGVFFERKPAVSLGRGPQPVRAR